MNDLKKLAQMAFEYKAQNCPTMPKYAIPLTAYSDKSANALTKCVHDFLKIKGHYCGRTNTTGTYNAKLGRFIHSGATRGQSDLNAIVNGRSWQIEIKYGKDKLSEVQLRIKKQVEAAGGVYMEVRSFEDFILRYAELTQELFDQLYNFPSSIIEVKELPIV